MRCRLQGGHLDRSCDGPIQDPFIWSLVECISLIVHHILGRGLSWRKKKCQRKPNCECMYCIVQILRTILYNKTSKVARHTKGGPTGMRGRGILPASTAAPKKNAKALITMISSCLLKPFSVLLYGNWGEVGGGERKLKKKHDRECKKLKTREWISPRS